MMVILIVVRAHCVLYYTIIIYRSDLGLIIKQDTRLQQVLNFDFNL